MDTIVNDKVNRYASLVKEMMPVDMIILYGSYARGTERTGSDIDIAIVVDELDGDYLDISSRLFSLTRQVDAGIEPKLIIRKNNRSGFLESILKYGKIVYRS